jgi:hypothetical protein
MNHKLLLLVVVIALGFTACPITEEKLLNEAPGSGIARQVNISTFQPTDFLPGQPPDYQPGRLSNVEWLAVQDGNGNWKTVQGTAGSYSFDVTNEAGKYAFALSCGKIYGDESGTTSFFLELRFLTIADTTLPQVGCRNYSLDLRESDPTSYFNVRIENRRDNTSLGVYLLDTSFINYKPGLDFPIFDPSFYEYRPVTRSTGYIPAGKYMLLLGEIPAGDSKNANFYFNRYVLDRNIDINVGENKQLNYNFDTQSFNPVSKPIRIVNFGSDEYLDFSGGVMLSGYPLMMTSQRFTAKEVPSTGYFQVFPDEKMNTEDTYMVSARTSRSLKTGFQYRSSRIMNRTIPQELQLPSDFQVLGSVISDSSRVTPNITWNKSIDGNGIIRFKFDESLLIGSIAKTTLHWNSIVSKNWIGSRKEMTMPNLSQLAGWTADWEFKRYDSMTWDADFYETNLKFSQVIAISGIDRLAGSEFTANDRREMLKNIRLTEWGYHRNLPDATPPFIGSTYPVLSEPGASIVTINTKTPAIQIYFSERMDLPSVEASYASDNLPLRGVEFVWRDPRCNQYNTRYNEPSTLTLIPKTILSSGATYSFTIGAGAKDFAGNPMLSPRTFTFKAP